MSLTQGIMISQVTGIFSATIPETVESLARTFLKDPVRVTVGERNATAFNICQQLQFAGSEEGKVLLLQQLLTEGLKAPVLIFVTSKEKAVLLQRYFLLFYYLKTLWGEMPCIIKLLNILYIRVDLYRRK